MANTGFKTADPILGMVDVDDVLLKESELINRYVGYKLYTWGNNTSGGLGLGDVVSRTSPVQVGNLTNWNMNGRGAAPTNAGVFTKTDGTLWAWGNQTVTAPALGLGDVTSRSSPVQVGTLTDWYFLSSAGDGVRAIKRDGTLWVWGNNNLGGLGLGDIVHRSSPVQVGTATDWYHVSSGGLQSSTYAIKTNGTLWAWGDNTNGGLGLGDTVPRSSPVQVGSLTNWRVVEGGYSFTHGAVAIKTDGTLWVWGQNTNGNLGRNDTVHRSSPVQVGSLTDWTSVTVNTAGSVIATRRNGTLWAWGINTNGQLGLGDILSRSSPVQVGSLTNWKIAKASLSLSSVSMGIRTDGTLWVWGNNQLGGLGLGDTVHRSSPTQVGSLNSWVNIFSGTGTRALLASSRYDQFGVQLTDVFTAYWPPSDTFTFSAYLGDALPGRETYILIQANSMGGTTPTINGRSSTLIGQFSINGGGAYIYRIIDDSSINGTFVASGTSAYQFFQAYIFSVYRPVGFTTWGTNTGVTSGTGNFTENTHTTSAGRFSLGIAGISNFGSRTPSITSVATAPYYEPFIDNNISRAVWVIDNTRGSTSITPSVTVSLLQSNYTWGRVVVEL